MEEKYADYVLEAALRLLEKDHTDTLGEQSFLVTIPAEVAAIIRTSETDADAVSSIRQLLLLQLDGQVPLAPGEYNPATGEYAGGD